MIRFNKSLIKALCISNGLISISLIIISILGTNRIVAQCHPDDFAALKALYNSTNGDNWTDTTGWTVIRDEATCPVGYDLGDAYGVSLDGNGRVNILNVPSNNLNGTIPPELGLLSHLTMLRLYSNDLTGSIPSELSQLLNLVDLDLDNNELIGTIPAEMGSLSNLEIIWVTNNNLSGCYAPNLKLLCPQLTIAYIDVGNNFDALWAGFCASDAGICACDDDDFLALKALYNSTNGDSWTDTTGWTVIRDSTSCPLGFDLSSVYGVGLDAVYGRVDSIRLRNNNLTGILNDSIGMLSHIRTLNLSKNSIAGFIPDSLGYINTLEDFRIHENNLIGRIKTDGYQNLRIYSVNDNPNMTGGLTEGIGSLSNLEELWMSNNSVGGTMPESLGDLPKLSLLRIDGNNMVGCFPPNLLNLCDQLTDTMIADGNSFNASFMDFCSVQDGMCVDCVEDTVKWIGVLDQSWTEGANWDTGCAPMSNKYVELGDHADVNVSPTSQVSLRALLIDTTSSLHIDQNAIMTLTDEANLLSIGNIENHGQLQFNGGTGIGNGGVFENYGSITMDTISNNIQILNFGHFINQPTGSISLIEGRFEVNGNPFIRTTAPAAINNYVIPTDQNFYGILYPSMFENFGSITIDSTTYFGISNSGVFINNKDIVIRRTGGAGILNDSLFQNSEDGVIVISDLPSSDCRSMEGPDDPDGPDIPNSSIVKPDDRTFSKNNQSGCDFTYGVLNADIDGLLGISNEPDTNSIFLNEGSISLSNLSAGIGNFSRFFNDSLISMDSIDLGIYNYYEFSNRDSIGIINFEIAGVVNEDSIFNGQTADLYLSGHSALNGSLGLINESESSMINQGQVSIMQTSVTSALVLGSIINDGLFTLKDNFGDALRLGDSSNDAYWENNDGALLSIQSTDGNLIDIQSGSTFIGFPTIDIQD